MAAENKMPGTDVRGGAGPRRSEPVADNGHLAVAELVSDRPAAPSPFGDDQEFPLPVEQLSYQPINP